MLSSLLSAKVGATVAGVAVALGGTAVVAYTGSLPTGSQNASHSTIGTSVAQPSATPTQHPAATKTGKGPDAAGAAAFGLCNAWTHHQTNGASKHGKSKNSVAFKNLATAAGGADRIAAFCAAVPHPRDTGDATDEPTGEPTDEPTPSSSAHPTGRPSSLPSPSSPAHPSGRPSTLPTPVPGHPAGRPSSLPTPSESQPG